MRDSLNISGGRAALWSLILLSAAFAERPGAAWAQGAPAGAQSAGGVGAERALGCALSPAWRQNVTVGPPHARAQADWLQVTGKVSYDEDRTQHVTSPLSGRVVAVLVKPGDVVAVGQPLLTLASPEAAQYKAELHKDREDLRSAEAAYRRTRALLKDGAISLREAAEAESSLNKAKAECARDEAHLAALGLNVRKPGTEAQLVARQAGVVTARHVFAGQELRPEGSEPLLTVSDLNQVWIQADVYERDLAQVAVGAQARARVLAYPHELFEGTVAYVGDVVDPQMRSVKVRCQLANDTRRLKPEMFATVCLQAQKSGALAVPSEAVVDEGPHTYVVVVKAGDALVLREVKLGPLQNGQFPLLAGLAPDEQVVLRGALYVLEAARTP